MLWCDRGNCPSYERHFEGWRILVSAVLLETELFGPIMRFSFFARAGDSLTLMMAISRLRTSR